MCFHLNSKLLHFRIKTRSLTRVSVGGSLTGLSSQASLHARMPSSCGMLVYRDVTSSETRSVSGGIGPDS